LNNEVKKVSIGLIGLGAMGRGAAINLIKHNFEVIGFDIRKESLDWLKEQGGVPVSSIAQLAEKVKIIISFVVNSEQTESVLYGDSGLIEKLTKDSVVIACSTMDPAYVQNLCARMSKDGVALIDAPVTGGASGAMKGTLTIMGSGDPATFEIARPVLEAFGSNVYYLGAAGAGAKMKVLNQLLCGVHLAAAGEALAMAKQQGLPLSTTLEILNKGAANSWMLSDRGPRMISENFDNPASAVDIFVKDMSLVLDAARKNKFPAHLAHAAYLAFIEASARGFGAMDDSAVTTNYHMETRAI
jgi:3-hydroxyisobutyrate dehydrogenase